MNILQTKVTPRILIIVLSSVFVVLGIAWCKFDSHMRREIDDAVREGMQQRIRERLETWVGRRVWLGDTRLYVFDIDVKMNKIKCISSNGTLIDLDTWQVTLETQ